jgi:hypothetical protein
LKSADYNFVLQRRHQVLVTEEPNSDKNLPVEARVVVIGELSGIDEQIHDAENIYAFIGERYLALGLKAP